MKTKAQDSDLPSSTNRGGSIRRSCSRTSIASASFIRTTATSTSRSRKCGRSGSRKGVRLVIVVNEGLQYHVGKLVFQGEEAAKEAGLRALIKMKEGSIYSPKGLKDDVKAIVDGYGAGGFVDVESDPQGTPAGPAWSISPTSSRKAPVPLSNESTSRETPAPRTRCCAAKSLMLPGDVFNTVRVDISKQRLENLGYFEKVDTYPGGHGHSRPEGSARPSAGETHRRAQFRRRLQHDRKPARLRRADPGQLRPA